MYNNHPLFRFIRNGFLVFLLAFLVRGNGWSQTYSDGPIQLQVKLREVEVTFVPTDAGVFGVGFGGLGHDGLGTPANWSLVRAGF